MYTRSAHGCLDRVERPRGWCQPSKTSGAAPPRRVAYEQGHVTYRFVWFLVSYLGKHLSEFVGRG